MKANHNFISFLKFTILLSLIFLSSSISSTISLSIPTQKQNYTISNSHSTPKNSQEKLNNDFTNFLSQNNNASNYIEPYSIKIGPGGDLFVTGYYVVSPQNIDVFVLRMSPNGTIIFKTHFGGSSSDFARDIVVDQNGNSYVVGYTDSNNFFTKNAFRSTPYGGYDIFLAKLSPTGQILFSTYLGSYGSDFCRGIAINSLNQLVLACYSNSPLSNTMTQLDFSQSVMENITPVFYPLVYKIYLNGTPILDRAYYGNISFNSQGLALDHNSNIIIVGGTFNSGHFSSFVKIISGTSLQVLKNITIDESPFSWAFASVVDFNNTIWVAGITSALNITSPTGQTFSHAGGKYDVYLARINSSLDINKIIMFGGPADDIISWLSVDSNNNVVFTGRTDSKTFTTVNQSIIKNNIKYPGGTNIFVGEINSTGSIQFIRFLGGELEDTAKSVVVNPTTHDIFVAGATRSIKEFNLPKNSPNSLLIVELDQNGNIIYQKPITYLFTNTQPLINQVFNFLFPFIVLVIDLSLSGFITWKLFNYFKKRYNQS